MNLKKIFFLNFWTSNKGTSNKCILFKKFIHLDLSLSFSGEKNKTSYKDNTELQISRNARSLINEEDLKTKVFNTITSYVDSIKLGGLIDVRYLNNELEKIVGIEKIETVRTDVEGSGVPGVNLCIFNPIILYPKKC